MILSRRAACFLIGFALWNLYVWVTFVKNVWPDHHFDSFFKAHLAVGGFTVALGFGAGWIGVRALKAHRAQRQRDSARTTTATTTTTTPPPPAGS